MILRAVFFLLCSALTLPTVAQSKKTKSPLVLFTVNKKPVTADEFIYLYKKNHQNPAEDFTSEKIDEYLSLYVNFKLKVEEARKRGLDTTKTFSSEFNQYKDELRKPYLPGNGLADSLAVMTYERLKTEVKASHILIQVKPDAAPADTLRAFNQVSELRKRALAGEDFGKLASEHSEDPSAKINGGDLGYFTALQMVYPFENAAYTTTVGAVSPVIRTRFGYHILRVYDKRHARGEVEVSHIMLRTGEEKNNDQVKNLVFEIHDELQAGANWEELCKKYSEDVSTRDRGGKLQPFGTGGMNNVPEFERIAFELNAPGEISDPLQTQYGWHIIRLEKKLPLKPYAEMATSLKTKVSRDERTQLSKQSLQNKLRKDFGFSENPTAKEALFSKADTSLQKGKWKHPEPVSAEKLFTLDGKTHTVRDFVTWVYAHQGANAFPPSRYLDQLYSQYIDEKMGVLQEDAIIKKNPEYKFLLNEYYEGILLFEIMEKEVWKKASNDSTGQHQYYLAHADKYQAGDRVKAIIYSAAKADVLPHLKALIQAGDEVGIRDYISKNKIRSESGFYTRKDKALLERIPWEKGVHEVQNNEMYYLAWLKEILGPGKMSFEEARMSLVSDYQNYLEQTWVTGLRKKYPVKINEKGKKYVFEQLQKNAKN